MTQRTNKSLQPTPDGAGFDIGQGFLAIVNFAFVVIAASDKITTLVHVPAKVLVPILIPSAVLMVWLLGFILDRMQFMQAYQEEQNRRNEMLSAVHSAATKQRRDDDKRA